MNIDCVLLFIDEGLTKPLPNNTRTTWTPSMDRFFIDMLLDQARKGQKTEKTFSKLAWNQMTVSFNKEYGLQIDKEVLKNRHKKLRAVYMDMKTLLDQSGFGWDANRQMVTASDKVWDDYLKV